MTPEACHTAHHPTTGCLVHIGRRRKGLLFQRIVWSLVR